LAITNLHADGDLINFGDVPEATNALLQKGVAAYRHDPALADKFFSEALQAAPEQLPVYFCLYKIHTYQGNLDQALAVAENGLEEATRQAGLSPDWRTWTPQAIADNDAAHFALYTLKAIAFISLRRDERQRAVEILDVLKVLDPIGAIGWTVVAALADGVA
jgi:tetratricopeptide (TPR) repeat protein